MRIRPEAGDTPRAGSLVTPHLTRTARSMLVLGPGRRDTVPSLRIAVSVGIPLLVLLLTGHLEWSLFASFGSFSSFYARYVPTAVRLGQQARIGVLLVVCVGLGTVIARTAPSMPAGLHPWITAVGGTLAAAVTSVIIAEHGLRPAGAVFPVFALTAVASAPSSAPVRVAVAIAAASVAWCLLASAAGHLLGEANRGARPPGPVPGSGTASFRRQEAARYGVAALVAGVLATLSGIASPYWAQVAAVVPLSAPGRRAQVERGLHRVVGTVTGVAVTAFLVSFPSQPWQVLVWVVVLQFLAELFVLRNYALALTFITPLALLMVQLAHPRPVGPMLTARVVETAIGAAVGIGVVLGARVVERRRAPRADHTEDGASVGTGVDRAPADGD